MNPTIKTICVDDEYLALQLLESYISRVPELELQATFKSPMEALSYLKANPTDLLFLDVQMPVLSGNNLLKVLSNPPLTIFTTAYSDYAPEAFDLNAVDYLIKPFSFERFLQGIEKAQKQLIPPVENGPTPNEFHSGSSEFLVVKVDGRTRKIFLKDIRFIEGLKEYVRIHTADQRFVTLERLQYLEETLPHPAFLRVHKSYIVARDKVLSIEGNLLEVGSDRIPVSRSRREEVFDLIFGSKDKS
ncbi:MAG: response regulator transcription factor [Bacteroidetes bacterium]|nr:response regulator transcription factor [Bacteroidota bacterium]